MLPDRVEMRFHRRLLRRRAAPRAISRRFRFPASRSDEECPHLNSPTGTVSGTALLSFGLSCGASAEGAQPTMPEISVMANNPKKRAANFVAKFILCLTR